MRACLTRLSANVVQLYPLEASSFLGAAPGTAAPVGDRGLPQRICTIVREGGRYRLRDVGADRRGTLVNHKYVKDVVLAPGDEIRIGEVVLIFHQSGSASVGTLPPATGTDIEAVVPDRRP